MMRRIAVLFLLISGWHASLSQSKKIVDSLRHELAIASNDTIRVRILWRITALYQTTRPDSGLYYGYKSLALARQINYPYGEVRTMNSIGVAYQALGNFSRAIQTRLQAIKIADANHNYEGKAIVSEALSNSYREVKDYDKALRLARESKATLDTLPGFERYAILAQISMARIYLDMNQLDSALYHGQIAYENTTKLKSPPSWPRGSALAMLGRIQIKKGNTDLALNFFHQVLTIEGKNFNSSYASDTYLSMEEIYEQTSKTDSCIFYTNRALDVAQNGGFYSSIIDANILLSKVLESSNPARALQYSKQALLYKDLTQTLFLGFRSFNSINKSFFLY